MPIPALLRLSAHQYGTRIQRRLCSVRDVHRDEKVLQRRRARHQIIRPYFQCTTHLSHVSIPIVDGSHTAIGVPENAFDQSVPPIAQRLCEGDRKIALVEFNSLPALLRRPLSVQRKQTPDIGRDAVRQSLFVLLLVAVVVEYRATRELPAREVFAQLLG